MFFLMIRFPQIPLILFFFPISKIFHQKFAVSPVLLYLHPKLQIDLTIQHSLNLITAVLPIFFSILPCFPMMIPLCEPRSQMSGCINMHNFVLLSYWSIATAIPCGISSCKLCNAFSRTILPQSDVPADLSLCPHHKNCGPYGRYFIMTRRSSSVLSPLLADTGTISAKS